MCIPVGGNSNLKSELLKDVTREKTAVPTPPEQKENEANVEKVFGDDGKNIPEIKEENNTVIKSLDLYGEQSDNKYACIAKVEIGKDGKPKDLGGKVFSCIAKIENGKPDKGGIFSCVAKTEIPNIKLCKSEIPKDWNPEQPPNIKLCVNKIDPNKKEKAPDIYLCVNKIDPNKKDNVPDLHLCVNKVDPNDKGPGFYSCTYKIEKDDNLI